MSQIKNYLRLIRFSHTIFAMPFALIGFCLGLFSIYHSGSRPVGRDVLFRLLLVLLCMIFARSAAMAFNRWLDLRFDAINPRTALREIPAGVISRNKALLFVLVTSAAFVFCTWWINPLCFYLSFVALAVVLGYSYTKRFTPLCHLILGIGLSLAPIGAYLAVTGSFAWLPLLFSLTVIFWVSGFDIIYALQDEEFDRAQRLYSMPSWLGKSKALKVSEILHLLSAAFVVAAGWYGHFGIWFWVGFAVFAGMLLYQHALVKPDDLSRVNLAFMTANGVASIVFAVFVVADLYLS
jgi:4-hydroxybenzoate polyprenyltransferase